MKCEKCEKAAICHLCLDCMYGARHVESYWKGYNEGKEKQKKHFLKCLVLWGKNSKGWESKEDFQDFTEMVDGLKAEID
jgi:hypothetical protein